MIIIKETFEEANPETCNYLPWGPDLKSCVEYCENPSKDIKQFYNNCNTKNCINLCNECDDIDRCQWVNPFVKDVNSVDTNFNPEIQLTVVTDNENSIYFTRYSEDEVNIEWEDINMSTKYMIHYVEGTQMNNNVKIIFTDLNFFKFNKDKNKTDENNPIINSGSTYLFKIYGLNIDEPTTESNILSVST
jgi:hypothetical protein